jgi:hypothetical protein
VGSGSGAAEKAIPQNNIFEDASLGTQLSGWYDGERFPEFRDLIL